MLSINTHVHSLLASIHMLAGRCQVRCCVIFVEQNLACMQAGRPRLNKAVLPCVCIKHTYSMLASIQAQRSTTTNTMLYRERMQLRVLARMRAEKGRGHSGGAGRYCRGQTRGYAQGQSRGNTHMCVQGQAGERGWLNR